MTNYCFLNSSADSILPKVNFKVIVFLSLQTFSATRLFGGVSEGGPAEKGGIKSGDIILEFDGEKIKTMRNLPRVVANTKPNKRVTVKLWRDKKMISKKLILGRMESAKEFKDK